MPTTPRRASRGRHRGVLVRELSSGKASGRKSAPPCPLVPGGRRPTVADSGRSQSPAPTFRDHRVLPGRGSKHRGGRRERTRAPAPAASMRSAPWVPRAVPATDVATQASDPRGGGGRRLHPPCWMPQIRHNLSGSFPKKIKK